MALKIQLRRDVAADWTSSNPTLDQGEVGIVLDTDPIKFKIGDGVKAWADLGYAQGAGTAADIQTLLNAPNGVAKLNVSGKVDESQLKLAEASGIATLGADTKVPIAQLPVGTAGGIPSLDGSSKVPIAQLPAGSASGIATLGADSKVPIAQIPTGADGVALLDTNGLLILSQLPMGSSGAPPKLDSNDEVLMTNLPTAKANGLATLGADGKIPSAQLDVEVTQASILAVLLGIDGGDATT